MVIRSMYIYICICVLSVDFWPRSGSYRGAVVFVDFLSLKPLFPLSQTSAKSREHSNEKNPESTKVDCTSSNKRRDRNKQHEGENSKEQASLLKKDRNWK